MIHITVAFANDQVQIEQQMSFPLGTSVQEVYVALTKQRSDIKDVVAYGVYGKRVSENYQLCSGDRLELYQALLVDPKQRRRQRAAAKNQGS